jgi:hypothetical protein
LKSKTCECPELPPGFGIPFGTIKVAEFPPYSPAGYVNGFKTTYALWREKGLPGVAEFLPRDFLLKRQQFIPVIFNLIASNVRNVRNLPFPLIYNARRRRSGILPPEIHIATPFISLTGFSLCRCFTAH